MSSTQRGAPVATYEYRDDEGWPVFCVDRYEPKSFGIRHVAAHDSGGTIWKPGLGGARRVLYRLPELLASAPSCSVYLCEGEKDADALTAIGLTATTNYGGAGSWHDEYTATLTGRHVVILPDNDDAGRSRALKVSRALRGKTASITTLDLPGLPDHGDVSDWLAAGGTAQELSILAAMALSEPDDHTEEEDDGPVAIVTRLDMVVPTPVEWLWEGWLPRGKLVLLGGHPGDGKSTLTTAMAATLSTGRNWPDGSPAPLGATLFLLAEDSLGDTVRPRLEQHGAHLPMVHSIDAIRPRKGAGPQAFSLSEHLPVLEREIRDKSAVMVVIDPLSAFMSARNRNDDGDTRDVLTPLGQIAERCNVAIVGIMHIGKPGATRRTPLQSLMGSTAFGAVARQALMVLPAPESDHKLLAVIKSNLATKPRPLEWSRPQDSAIIWHGESQHDLETLFNSGGETKLPREDAEAFLTAALANGPRLSREVFEEAGQLGISERTLQRASRQLGTESRRIGPGRDAPWYMGLPGIDWAQMTAQAGGTLRAVPAEQPERQIPVPISGGLVAGGLLDPDSREEHSG